MQRIHFYTTQSAITNDWFATLRGNKITAIEKERALFMGALTPLVDDLNDELKLGANQIWEMVESTENSELTNILLAKHIYTKRQELGSNRILNQCDKALKAQEKSIQQLGDRLLSAEELNNIAYEKGGAATLLYRMALENDLKPEEKSAVMELGYLLQLTNDLFDIYKDLQNKQQTIYTNFPNCEALHQYYVEQIDCVFNSFNSLSYDKNCIDAFLKKISLIISRGLVASNQLREFQQKNGKAFKLQKCKRKELICDMDNLKNIIKSIKYSVKLSKKISTLSS